MRTARHDLLLFWDLCNELLVEVHERKTEKHAKFLAHLIKASCKKRLNKDNLRLQDERKQKLGKKGRA